jgi:hypothetical protein
MSTKKEKQASESIKATVQNSQKMRCKMERWEQEALVYQVFTFLAGFLFFLP